MTYEISKNVPPIDCGFQKKEVAVKHFFFFKRKDFKVCCLKYLSRKSLGRKIHVFQLPLEQLKFHGILDVSVDIHVVLLQTFAEQF